MYKTFIILILMFFCSNAVQATDKLTSDSEDVPSNFMEAMLSKKYEHDTLVLYENKNSLCPNLTKDDCETKETRNSVLGKCKVCLIRKGEKCDQMLDGCEQGTMCLPENLQNLNGVNICTEFSLKDWEAVKKASRKEKKRNKLNRKNKVITIKCNKKCQKHQKKLQKLNRLTRKFANRKKPCKAHWKYLNKNKNKSSWKLVCTRDGFYSTKTTTCLKKKCWCVDKNGFYLKKASKNSKKYCE